MWGRIRNSTLPFNTIHPMILPPDHYVTGLIIQKAHLNVYHNGVKETLIQLRSKFWIVKGRQIVKKYLNKCNTCRKLEGLSYGSPSISQLPKSRVEGGQAFQGVGIDFCGPLYLANPKGETKSYIALITCTSSRMVHLELCGSLEAATLIGCLKRFFARRGTPSLIISDNAKTFKSEAIKKFTATRGITWHFNLAKAPWWGGLFERLIRSTKRCLKKTLKLSRLDFEQMTTVIAETEAVLNSRPLTYLHPDSVDILTPFHLYTGNRVLDPPDPRVLNFEVLNSDQARQRVQKLDHLIGQFWTSWSQDYLTNLREISQNLGRKGINPKVGDVVVIHEDSKKRVLWKLGRVIELLRGKDNVVRGAKVKTDSRMMGGIIERPLQKLFPLEMGRGENENENSGENEARTSMNHSDPSNIDTDTVGPRYTLRSHRK